MGLGTRFAGWIAGALDALVRQSAPLARHPIGVEVTLLLARALRYADRHRGGRIDVSRAGRALLHAWPEALSSLAARLPEGAVLISATNGKTTTTTLLTDMLRSDGRRPVTNRAGANMPGGLVAELVAQSRLGRRMDADLAVFEVDELWLDIVAGQLQPRMIVLGNLFRDQLDRIGEVDRLGRRWADLVSTLPPQTTLVVNADDARVCQLAGAANVTHFGLLADPVAAPVVSDQPTCLRCGSALDVGGCRIGHLGDWSCPGCGDRRPGPMVEARLDSADGSAFTLVFSDQLVAAGPPASNQPRAAARRETAHRAIEVTWRLRGRFMVANAVAAAAAATELGVDPLAIGTALRRATGAFGRGEIVSLGDRSIELLLAKNSTGLDELIRLIDAERHLLFLLNDADLDGMDVSWIWDANLEAIGATQVSVTCGGTRADELALRLVVAGVAEERVAVVPGGTAAVALDHALRHHGGDLVVVANYTGILDLRELLAERGHVARYWA